MDLQLKGEIQEIITRVVFSEVRYGHCIELGIELEILGTTLFRSKSVFHRGQGGAFVLEV